MVKSTQDDLLSSWKRIADYLECDVRTARRWEESYGLPVYRIGSSSRARVHSYRHELDEWIRRRTGQEKTERARRLKALGRIDSTLGRNTMNVSAGRCVTTTVENGNPDPRPDRAAHEHRPYT